MKHRWMLWLLAGCAVVVLAALAWVSFIVLRLEEAGAESRRQALLEENTRLALWRMESMLAPFIAQENARPYYSYQAFFPAERAYTRMMARLEPNEILIPSPLLVEVSPHVRLYFQFGPAGELSSPQIPTSSLHGKAMEGYSRAGQIEESARWLKKFADDIPRQALLASAPSEWLAMERPNGVGNDAALFRSDERRNSAAKAGSAQPSDEKAINPKGVLQDSEAKQNPKPQSLVGLAQEVMKNSPAQVANQIVTVPQQQEQKKRNETEYQARLNTNLASNSLQSNTQEEAQVSGAAMQRSLPDERSDAPAAESFRKDQKSESSQDTIEVPSKIRPPQPLLRRSRSSRPAEIKISLLKPVWVRNELILLRRVRIDHDEYLQGCWLDWPQLQTWLVSGIQDLFPKARLDARRDGSDQGRSLAALPVSIQPGPLTANLPLTVSPIRFSLWVAWLCAVAAILAAAILFWGTHSLSERRAAFVSAVTHELRTPLTTFRLYTEMLAEGMVPDEEQRRQYLNTLKRESDRQYHLIENVLAYSRMEKGRYGQQKEFISLGIWLGRIQPRLMELAERSAMTLVPADEDALASLQLLTDVAALERILFNLADNACKYARCANDKRIHIEVNQERKRVLIRIRDHGPGIASKDSAKLFEPFHKSARDAANSAPGVGLGLSLCRRLAQSIGGELSLEQNHTEGAAFLLVLPLEDRMR